jgi:hypothetical protein
MKRINSLPLSYLFNMMTVPYDPSQKDVKKSKGFSGLSPLEGLKLT